MSRWENLAFKRAQLRLFFWAAKQMLLLVALWVLLAATIAEAVSKGSLSALHQLLALVD